MDHFNCRLASEDKSFNKLTYQKVIKLDLPDINSIFDYLIRQKGLHFIPFKATPFKATLLTEYFLYKKKENKGAIKVEEDDEIIEPGVTKNLKTDATEFNHEDRLNHQMVQSNKKNKAQEQNNQIEEEKKLWYGYEKDFVAGKVSAIESEEEDNEQEDYDEENEDDYYYEEEEEEEDNCCEKHCPYEFDPFNCESVKRFKRKLQTSAIQKKNALQDNFTVMIMDQKIEIRLANIGIDEKNIYFNDAIPGFNFAASAYDNYMEEVYDKNRDTCWIYGDYKKSDYVDSKKINLVLYKNLPSIPYQVTDQGYHLKLELFGNNLIRKGFDTIEKYWIHEDPEATKTESYNKVIPQNQLKKEVIENTFEEI